MLGRVLVAWTPTPYSSDQYNLGGSGLYSTTLVSVVKSLGSGTGLGSKSCLNSLVTSRVALDRLTSQSLSFPNCKQGIIVPKIKCMYCEARLLSSNPSSAKLVV